MQYGSISVFLDSYSVVILLILVFYLMGPSNRKNSLNRIFILICAANLAMLLGDIPTWLCQGNTAAGYRAAVWLGCLLQYAGGVALPLAYTCYVVKYLSPKVRVKRGPLLVILLLGLTGAVCVVVNLWNGMYYYMDEYNIYHRGSWWILSQVIAVLTLAIDAGIVFYYRHMMGKKDVWSFLGYNICPLAAIAVQSCIYGASVTYPATTITILVIFVNIQSEQALRLEQSEKELIEERVSVMLSQIQPHFLYNALAAIRQLCRTNPAETAEAVGEFAQFLRGNMDSLNQKGLIPFSQELVHVQSYLALEKRRFASNLQIVYDIRCSDFEIPPLSLQPIVENAVRHGRIAQREGGGVVTIHTGETDTAWKIMINDNGKGMNTVDIPMQDGKSHIGIENVRWRLKTLADGTLEISSFPGKGTTVTISIPKRKNQT